MFSGLDKITGRTISFDAAIGETVQFGALQVTARACYTRPPTEATNTDAFVEVDEVTLQGEIKRIFTGWMFASSPGLHAVEHPIYDVWLTDCAATGRRSVAQSTPPPAPAAGAAPAAPTVRGRQARAPARNLPRHSAVKFAGARHRRLTAIIHSARFASAVSPETGRSSGERAEICFADERCIEQLVIGRPRHFDGAECPQMVGDELGVEQPVMAGLEPRHQMHERDLRSVARAVEHALAEKGAAETDAIEAADQLLAVIDLDGVAVAALVELAIEIADAGVDPGARASRLRLRAAVDDGIEIAIDRRP